MRAPALKAGSGPRSYEGSFEQHYQDVAGSFKTDNTALLLRNGKLRGDIGNAGDVAARPRQACDHASADWVPHHRDSIVLFLTVSVVGHERSGRGGVHLVSWLKANTLAVNLTPGVWSTTNNINSFKVTVLKADGSVDLAAIPAKGYKIIVVPDAGLGVSWVPKAEDNFGGNFSIVNNPTTNVNVSVKVIKCVDSFANCKEQQLLYGPINFKITAP